MELCENAFCGSQVIELEYVAAFDRKFCCIACAEDWQRQNEALISAASSYKAKSGKRVSGPSEKRSQSAVSNTV